MWFGVMSVTVNPGKLSFRDEDHSAKDGSKPNQFIVRSVCFKSAPARSFHLNKIDFRIDSAMKTKMVFTPKKKPQKKPILCQLKETAVDLHIGKVRRSV